MLLLGSVAACGPLRTAQRALQPSSPHEDYTRSLQSAGLHDTALGRAWIGAARDALAAPVPVTTPFEEIVYVDPSQPRAVGYAVSVRRGQSLVVEATLSGDVPASVFVDLFEPDQATADGRPSASAPQGTARVEHPASHDGVLLVRVQPELLRGGELRVRTVAQATLLIPVEGATAQSIQGLFGGPRDGGRRTHEGIDIFAPRGTLVTAAARGIVTSVGENRLGGRVVWLRDERGYTHYYAHLDAQLVGAGARVEAGDPIGRVGNSGNARTTSPHLHFGVYRRGEGALDPQPFVQPMPLVASPPALAVEALGSWVRVQHDRTVLRSGPGAANDPRDTLARHTAVAAVGTLGPWVRVALPDGRTGFLQAAQITRAQPWRRARTARAVALRVAPGPGAPARRTLAARSPVEVLGRFEEYLLVRLDADEHGWVAAALVS